jgi:hypothetical protein
LNAETSLPATTSGAFVVVEVLAPVATFNPVVDLEPSDRLTLISAVLLDVLGALLLLVLLLDTRGSFAPATDDGEEDEEDDEVVCLRLRDLLESDDVVDDGEAFKFGATRSLGMSTIMATATG